MDDPKEQISQIEELLEELVANPEDISISGTAKKIYWAIMSNQKIEELPHKRITAIKVDIGLMEGDEKVLPALLAFSGG